MHVEKPLLGFGWMGWVLLAIAGALVVVWVTGYDLQYQLLAITHALFGDYGVYSVSAYLIYQGISCTHENSLAQFSLWGLCASLIVLHIYPKRISLWRVIPLIVWAVSAPILNHSISRLIHNALPDSTSIFVSVNIAYATDYAIVCIMLWFMSRSLRVAVGVSVLFGVTIVFTVISTRYLLQFRPGWLVALERIYLLAWNPLLLAILLSWAIPARIRYNRWWLCFKCGYNMRDLESTTCPECGAINTRMPSPATPSSP